MKRIAIIGCGAMGAILGAYMTKAGCDVEMVDTNQPHVDAMNKDGVRVIGLAEFTQPVKAITPDQMSGIYDLTILLTKQMANKAVLTHLVKFMNDDSVVCTLQNGVPEPDVAAYVGEKRTVGGATNWSATYEGPGICNLTTNIAIAQYLFEIGEVDGQITPRIEKISELLGHMGTAKITDTLMASRWGKLVFNTAVSGLSAVCGITFGEVVTDPVSRACCSYIGREVKKCCEAEGYALPPVAGVVPMDSLDLVDQEMFEANQKLFQMMGMFLKDGKASMLQDLEKGLETEVGVINGHVSMVGDKYGFETPFNDKVVEVVRRIEKGEITCSPDNMKYFHPENFEFQILAE
ncbi:MAG: 2-dehydropantoate 2-reductase [Oscillospiraceae bacterium]|nr:2-dehydropantoate 2-reductase [Oscillospiraceae bacterium]